MVDAILILSQLIHSKIQWGEYYAYFTIVEIGV